MAWWWTWLIFWLPCAFPVVGVALLCVAALVMQARRDRGRRKGP